MKHSLLVTSIVLSSMLIGCNSKDNTTERSNNTAQPETVTQQNILVGKFVDAPIANIQYKTATRQGTTNANGEYEYINGEQVTFYIGQLELPTVLAKNTVTPLDMSEIKDVNDKKVVNIIRLLQTLDKDGNPDNGIEIPETAASIAQALNFDLSTEEFENLDALKNLIINANPGRVVSEMVSTKSAKQHFNKQLVKFGVKAVKNIKDTSLEYQNEKILESNYYIVEKSTEKNCSISGWSINKVYFSNDGNYTTKDCNNLENSGSYQVIDDQLALVKNGFMNLQKRLSYDATTNSFESCITDPSNNEKNCLNKQRSHEFSSLVDAKSFITKQEKTFLQNTALYFVNTVNPDCSNSNIEFLSFERDNYTYTACDNSTETGSYKLLNNTIIQLKNNDQTKYLKLSNNTENLNTYFYCGTDDLDFTNNCVADSDIAYKTMADAIQVTSTNQ